MGWACSYVAMTSLWSSSQPILASLSACSLPLIFVWALTLCSVVICVRDFNNLIVVQVSLCLGDCCVRLGVLFVYL